MAYKPFIELRFDHDKLVTVLIGTGRLSYTKRGDPLEIRKVMDKLAEQLEANEEEAKDVIRRIQLIHNQPRQDI
jgi:hypothetical protein